MQHIDPSNSGGDGPPLTPAVHHGDRVYVSGQVPIDASGAFVEGDIESQTRQVIRNVSAVLSAADSSLDRLLKITVFLENPDDYDRMNAIYEEMIPTPYPARSAIGVSLAGPFDIEIEAIAAAD